MTSLLKRLGKAILDGGKNTTANTLPLIDKAQQHRIERLARETDEAERITQSERQTQQRIQERKAEELRESEARPGRVKKSEVLMPEAETLLKPILEAVLETQNDGKGKILIGARPTDEPSVSLSTEWGGSGSSIFYPSSGNALEILLSTTSDGRQKIEIKPRSGEKSYEVEIGQNPQKALIETQQIVEQSIENKECYWHREGMHYDR